jgi:hypothetical protein
MITVRQEQIENAIEVLDHARAYIDRNFPSICPFDLADVLALRILRRLRRELQIEFDSCEKSK